MNPNITPKESLQEKMKMQDTVFESKIAGVKTELERERARQLELNALKDREYYTQREYIEALRTRSEYVTRSLNRTVDMNYPELREKFDTFLQDVYGNLYNSDEANEVKCLYARHNKPLDTPRLLIHVAYEDDAEAMVTDLIDKFIQWAEFEQLKISNIGMNRPPQPPLPNK